MGVSSRTVHAIEPGTGDLMMPDRSRGPRALRTRDVEDACFETVGGPRDVFSQKRSAGENGGVFKSRLTRSSEHGPFPSDFALYDRVSRQADVRSERLGIFTDEAAALGKGGYRGSIAASAIVVIMCGFAAAAFWMSGVTAGGHAPARRTEAQASIPATPATPALPVPGRGAVSVDPVVTSSVTAKNAGTAKGGFTVPAPRPARIERAGSILMIRPAGG